MAINNKGPKGPAVYLPIEVTKREYAGKLLLAVETAYQGRQVYIGHKAPILYLAKQANDQGVLLYKSARGPGTEFMESLEQKGFIIAAQDEEGGPIYRNFREFYETRISLRTAGSLGNFYCWGPEEFDFLKKKNVNNSSKFFLTGSPRTVLWGSLGREFYTNEIDAIRRYYGRYVVFCTNFASGNSYLSESDQASLLSDFYDAKDAIFENHKTQVERDKALMNLFLYSAKEVAEATKLSVVIRPHPGEDSQVWRRLTADIEGVFVEDRGPLTPWILGSECIIQNGCTSALEAVSAGIPTIALGHSRHDLLIKQKSISNHISLTAESSGAVIQILKGLSDFWKTDSDRRWNLVNSKLYKTGTIEPVSRVAGHLTRLAEEMENSVRNEQKNNELFNGLRIAMQQLRGKCSPRKRQMNSAKREGLSLSKVSSDVEKALAIFGYESSLHVKKIADSAFVISLNVESR